jgi:hypothetical protein
MNLLKRAITLIIKNMYIVHDRLFDTYRGYKHLTDLAKREKISINTLRNKFTRERLRRHVTSTAKVIVKTDLI